MTSTLIERPSTFEDACELVVLDLADLITSKQNDYGKDNILGFGEQGLVVRLWDKVNRLKNLVWHNTRPKNESVEDTLNDIAGYAIIGLMLRKGWFELPMKEDKNG